MYGKLEQDVSVCATGTTLAGIDVSHYDGAIDWPTVASGGIKWAYAKASESTSYVDPTFSGHWSNMRSAGVVRGAYHFFHPDIDGKTQADHFLNTVGTIDATDLPPVLDWETSTATGNTAAANAQAFIDEVKLKTGRKTIVYTSPGLWSQFNISQGFFMDPLWVAHYKGCTPGPSCCPTMPTGWSGWVMWQWDDTTSVSGVNGSTQVDVDVFNGTGDDLNSFINSTIDNGTGGGTGAGGGIASAGGGTASAGGGIASAGGGTSSAGGGTSSVGGGTTSAGGGTASAGGGSGELTGGGTAAAGGGAGGGSTPEKHCGCTTSPGFALGLAGLLRALRRRRS
jgi:lysozyme